MNENNPLIEQISNKAYVVQLNNEIYSQSAVLSASNKFSDFFYIKVNIEDNNLIITFEFKEYNPEPNLIQSKINEFCNEALEQQVREDINRKFGNLRESIYNKAFSFMQD